VYGPDEIDTRLASWETWFDEREYTSLSQHPRWLVVLRDGLKHQAHCVEAVADGHIVGLLPLEFVQSRLFGRFLVSLPYLNTGGVLADRPDVAVALVDRAVELADQLDVKYLELRHESELAHSALTEILDVKVHMRLSLPSTSDELWASFKPKVRNQIRKGEKQGFTVSWGADELLDDFYAVFSRNMRDLGTPVFSRKLFGSVLNEFSDWAELCVLRKQGRPIAAALLCHGQGVTEVPSASSLREFRSTNANMAMYWQLLSRAIDRWQHTFDFGRSTLDSSNFRFKKQWGAKPEPAIWQYYVRKGQIADMRRESGKYAGFIRVWQHLPVSVSRRLGPMIVRGIP
jgi:FemAB-related protein (PEP-CTERM system-associated)